MVIAAGRVVASGPLESVVGSHAGLEEAFLELTTGTDPFHASWLLSLAVLAPAQASSVMVTAGAAVPGRAALVGRRAGAGWVRRCARRLWYGVGQPLGRGVTGPRRGPALGSSERTARVLAGVNAPELNRAIAVPMTVTSAR